MTIDPATDNIIDDDPLAAVASFVERLACCCAAVDYDGARPLFAPDVASFGTKAAMVTGLDPLQRNQWERIWPNIEGFGILLESLHGGGDGRIAWGMVPWTSVGFSEDGARFERRGRATVVLERRGHRWLAVHTHFSLEPGTPPVSHGAPDRTA